MNIQKIRFGFPCNITVNANTIPGPDIQISEADKKYLETHSEVNLKIILSCTSEEKKHISEAEEEYVSDIINHNISVVSVKIVYDVQRETHIRSKKIIEAKTNKDKLTEFLAVNKLKSTDSLFNKLKDIEDNLDIKYFVPCHSFTLLKAEIRGAIGIKEGGNKEELDVDFSDFTNGIIAITGPSGSGKTTFIENCHPYPQMLTRNGKLQDHFYLKDSYRKLTYIDEEDTYYRIEMYIDGKTKNGKCKYLVFKGKDVNNLAALKECDGNVEPYENWVNNNFGSIDLFLRTAYIANKKTGSISDISEAKKGEKKALFSSLIGIDGLELISVQAKSLSKTLTKNYESISSQVIKINPEEESIEEYDRQIKDSESKLEEAMSVKSNLESELLSKQDEINRLKDVNENKHSLESEVTTLTKELELLQEDINFYNSYNKGKNDKYISNYTAFENFVKQHSDWVEKEYNPARFAYLNIESEMKSLAKEIEFKKEYLSNYSVPDIKDTCPTCNQKLPTEEINKLKEKVDKKIEKKKELEEELSEKIKEYETLVFDYEHHPYLEAEKKMEDEESTRIKLEGELNGQFNINEVYEDKRKFESIDKDFIEDKISSVTKSISRINDMLKDLSSVDLNSLDEHYNNLKKDIEEAKERVYYFSELSGRTKALKDSFIKKLEKNKECESKLKVISKDITEFDLLAKAFGPDGIAALELEAMAPDIADITNDILNEVFGDKFKISFRTLRQGSDGHYIEDFSILVENTKTGIERPLEWISGGETVVIKEALYHAFSIIRSKSTNFSMKTKFLDESDGALDGVSRTKYLGMIKAAHKDSGVVHTVLITHSQELKDVIEQNIKF